MFMEKEQQEQVVPHQKHAATIGAAGQRTVRPPVNMARKIADKSKTEHGFYEAMQTFYGNVAGVVGAYLPCLLCFSNPFKVVPQGHVGMISHFGKVLRIVDPGLYFINPSTESIRIVSLSLIVGEVPRQSVMTKDNVVIDIDSVLYYQVIDPFSAAFYVQDVHRAIIERTVTTLRDSVGAYDLQTIIENKDMLPNQVENIISSVAESWGVYVESILIKDLRFTPELEETLASAARQKRVGESKIISATAEVESAKLMREAADLLNTSAAMQIRYLDTMQQMSRQPKAKVVFMPTSDIVTKKAGEAYVAEKM